MKKKFENFGKLARHIRTNNNMTQSEVAEMIGAHSQTVSNCERGLAAYPKPEIKAFVKKLNLHEAERAKLLDAIIADYVREKRAEWSKPLGLKP